MTLQQSCINNTGNNESHSKKNSDSELIKPNNLWVYCTGSYKPSVGKIPNIAIFDYHNSGVVSCLVDYLGDCTQNLQVDGYQAYGKPKYKLACYMAHTQRNFIEA